MPDPTALVGQAIVSIVFPLVGLVTLCVPDVPGLGNFEMYPDWGSGRNSDRTILLREYRRYQDSECDMDRCSYRRGGAHLLGLNDHK